MNKADAIIKQAEIDLIDQVIAQRKAERRYTLTRLVGERSAQIEAIAAEIPVEDIAYYYVAIEERAGELRDYLASSNTSAGVHIGHGSVPLLNYIGVVAPFEKNWDDAVEHLHARAVVLCRQYDNGDDAELIAAVVAALSKENEELAEDIARGENSVPDGTDDLSPSDDSE